MQDLHLRKIRIDKKLNYIKELPDVEKIRHILINHALGVSPHNPSSGKPFFRQSYYHKILSANAVKITAYPVKIVPMQPPHLSAEFISGVFAGAGYVTDRKSTQIVFPQKEGDRFLLFLAEASHHLPEFNLLLYALQIRSSHYLVGEWREQIRPTMLDIEVALGYICTNAVNFSTKRGGKFEFRSFRKDTLDYVLKQILRQAKIKYTKTMVTKPKHQPSYYRFETYGHENCEKIWNALQRYQGCDFVTTSRNYRALKRFMEGSE